jgi:four helix bundle protein
MQPSRHMDRNAEDLKVRTQRFAEKVLEFVGTLPKTPECQELARQLTRAALGVAGNYRSSCRGRSHGEFTARLGLVLDEADESQLWTDVAEKRGWGDATMREWLLQESGELRAIFSKGYFTARSNENTRRKPRRRRRCAD